MAAITSIFRYCTEIVTDIIYLLQNLNSTYASGNFLDLGWLMGSYLFGLAGVLQADLVNR